MPAINRKFKMFPNPKYRNIKKMIIPDDVMKPRLELINIIEEVKNSAKKTTKKKINIAPVSNGSMKYIIPAAPSQRRSVIINVNKKFLRSFTSFFRSMIFLLKLI